MISFNTVLVDKNISKSSAEILSKNGLNVLTTTKAAMIDDCTSTHPDMQFLKFKEKEALVESSTYEYYKSLLPDFKLIPIYKIHSPYPKDCLLNVTVVGEYCFLTEFQNMSIGEYFADFNKIFVKQGYTKCNICILNDSAILTSDQGIIKEAKKHGLKAYYLPADQIALNGYTNGFWGGCSGLIGANKLFFNGNIEKLSCYNELTEILYKEKIEPIYDMEGELTDIGSIINVI